MTESYIQQSLAARIGGKSFGKSTAIYKFEKIKRAKRAALEAHPHAELIDLGVGEPDEMAFPLSVRALSEEAQKLENRGYADNGGPDYRRAAAQWMRQSARFASSTGSCSSAAPSSACSGSPEAARSA